jgi:hypothetical protein
MWTCNDVQLFVVMDMPAEKYFHPRHHYMKAYGLYEKRAEIINVKPKK